MSDTGFFPLMEDGSQKKREKKAAVPGGTEQTLVEVR